MAQPKRVIGLLAHVDAGKTTAARALLSLSPSPATAAASPALDYYPDETARGITVFSKGARLHLDGGREMILLDTPGHVDFAPETERTLAVLDAAVLVISAPDGIQSHTKTLWDLLRARGIPTLLFVNKTDLPYAGPDAILRELATVLSPYVFPLTVENETQAQRQERLATVCDEWMEQVLGGGCVSDDDLCEAFAAGRFFPVVFGAAVKNRGTRELCEALDFFTPEPDADDVPGAQVYQIRRTDDGVRLTLCRVTGGTLSVRDEISYRDREGKPHADKITQIRLYDGRRFVTADCAAAGEVCALLGLDHTYAGLRLGDETDDVETKLQPMLSYALLLPDGVSPDTVWPALCRIGEEEPTLSVTRTEAGGIALRLMGTVQNEIMTRVISERLGVPVSFGQGEILYRETLTAPVYGTGHYEPLRHYAEVKLKLEPLPRGSGIICETAADTDGLALKWQRAVLQALYDGDHRGVLVGAPLTDVKITLAAAAINQKHTDGGDIREAALRAVRHALMKAKQNGCVRLLEPMLRFTLSVPNALSGRALTDLQTAGAAYDAPVVKNDETTITGRGPFATLHAYAAEVAAYAHGKGRFCAEPDGFAPCQNADEVIAARGYDPTADVNHPPHSIFCAHGAGFFVPWDEVDIYAHIKDGGDGQSLSQPNPADSQHREQSEHSPACGLHFYTREPTGNSFRLPTAATSLPEGGLGNGGGLGAACPAILPSRARLAAAYALSTEEVEAIMTREFGPIKRRQYKTGTMSVNGKTVKRREPKPARLLIDGYNLLYADEGLAKEAEIDLERARGLLVNLLQDYAAYTHADVTLVFDAYRVPDNDGSETVEGGITVIYTKTGQTGDARLEAMAHEWGPDYDITLVTSDRLVQFSALHARLLRKSSREFWEELYKVADEVRDFIKHLNATGV